MQQQRFGRHRGVDWLARVAWNPQIRGAFCERFTLIAQDPKHPRTLYVTLSITQTKGADDATATAMALFDDGTAGPPQFTEESWSMDRARIDKERAGFGLGECFVGDGSTQGLVHNGEFALSWSMDAPSLSPVQNVMGEDTLFYNRLIDHKVALIAPSATIASGNIEIWHTPGRYAEKTQFDCAGWQVHQHHVFGPGRATPFVHLHVPPSSVDADSHSFDLFCLRTRILGMMPTTLFLAALQTHDQPQMARTWHYGGVVATCEQASLPWQFTQTHSGATFRGEVLANPQRVVKTQGATYGGSFALAFGATVRVSITHADGSMRAIVSDQAVVEVGDGASCA